MRNITKLLEKADKALNDTQLVNEGSVTSSKVGAIAGFGAMVINLDLLPALAVYQNNHKDIVAALGIVTDKNNLFQYCKDAQVQSLTAQRLLKTQIVDASVALKIMARTFKIVKDNE